MKHTLKQTLAGLLTAVMLTCPALAAAFPDVSGTADYAEAVEYVSDIGLMVGDDLGNFNPNKTVTRAEMATIICRMLGKTENLPRSDLFLDVPLNHWANPYVAKAGELGIIGGYGGGRFGPSDSVTYEQAVTMMIRTMGLEKEATEAGGYPDGYIAQARQQGILSNIVANNGDALSRSNVAILLYNYFVPTNYR